LKTYNAWEKEREREREKKAEVETSESREAVVKELGSSREASLDRIGVVSPPLGHLSGEGGKRGREE